MRILKKMLSLSSCRVRINTSSRAVGELKILRAPMKLRSFEIIVTGDGARRRVPNRKILM